MTDIPEDVMKAAEEAYLEAIYMTTSDDPTNMVQMVARAIMGERERCATVMDGLAKEYLGYTEEEWAFEHAADVLRGTTE